MLLQKILLFGCLIILLSCDNNSPESNPLEQITPPNINGDWNLMKVTEETWSDTLLCESRTTYRDESIRIENSNIHCYRYPNMKKFESNYIQHDSIIYFNDLNYITENKIFLLDKDTLILLHKKEIKNHFDFNCRGYITHVNTFYSYQSTNLNSNIINSLDKYQFNTELLKKNWRLDITALNMRGIGRFERILTHVTINPEDTNTQKNGNPTERLIDFEPKPYLNFTDINTWKINGNILVIKDKEESLNYILEYLDENVLLLSPIGLSACDTIVLSYEAFN